MGDSRHAPVSAWDPSVLCGSVCVWGYPLEVRLHTLTGLLITEHETKMLRRLKMDVLTELPPKRRLKILLDANSKKVLRAITTRMRDVVGYIEAAEALSMYLPPFPPTRNIDGAYG